MSYQNYKPMVWAKKIERELEKSLVFAADCNREYEGTIKSKGDSVKILGIARPTITRQVGGKIKLGEAEEVEDISTTLTVNQIATYNYKIDDIDKRQAVGGVMEALNAEVTQGMADEMDKFIADFAKDKFAVRHTTQATSITKDNILQTIDDVLAKLYANNVKSTNKITLTCSPWFYMVLKQAYTVLDTNNSKVLENGQVGKYGNVIIRMTNNVAKDTNGNDLVMVRTDKAISFVNAIAHDEAYRPEDGFADAIKGFALFDGKVTRPKEMFILNCKKA